MINEYFKTILLCMAITVPGLTSCDSYERTQVEEEIYVNKSEISMFVGESQTLLVSPADKGSVSWAVDAPDIVQVTDGVVVGLAPGSTTITATRGNSTFTIAVTVMEKHALTDINLSAKTLFGKYIVELLPGGYEKIEVTTVPGDANDVAVTDYKWWSENDQIARVHSDGTIVGVNEGSTTVHYCRGTITKDIAVNVSRTSPFRGPHILSKDTSTMLSFLDFDFGGPDVAWHDSSAGNSGNSTYRSDYGDHDAADVDIEGTTNIGWTADGEWLLFSIDVKDAGAYKMEVCASGNGGTIHFEVDDQDATGTFTIPSTSGWGDYQYNSWKELKLTQGRHKLKAYFDHAAYNVSSMRFTFITEL